jgi:D-glycero-alpha-D-manno-heptose 1-phosphate guanylyltransferase
MRLEDVHGVILAGGVGTRLRSVLPDAPKPLAPAEGRPFVEWVARWLAAAGVRSATVSTGYLGEMIARHFTANPVPGIAVDCVQEARPLGTAGGFLFAARGSRRTPAGWLVLNGDSLALADVGALAGQLERCAADAAIVACRVANAGRYGRLEVGPDGRLRRFAEKVAADEGPGLINAGVYLLRHALLDRFPDRETLSFEHDVFPAWLAADMPIVVSESDAPFLDIGTAESLALADDFIRQNQRRFP